MEGRITAMWKAEHLEWLKSTIKEQENVRFFCTAKGDIWYTNVVTLMISTCIQPSLLHTEYRYYSCHLCNFRRHPGHSGCPICPICPLLLKVFALMKRRQSLCGDICMLENMWDQTEISWKFKTESKESAKPCTSDKKTWEPSTG